jgi:predicted nucleic acid-binding protein
MATLSSLLILDTSIFVDYLRNRRHEDRIDSLTGIVRTSSVVLAELWRGASRADFELIASYKATKGLNLEIW